MAETSAPEPSHTHAENFGFLTRKLGPAPIWLWGVLVIGVYYLVTHYGPGAATNTSAGTASTQTPVNIFRIRVPGNPPGTTGTPTVASKIAVPNVVGSDVESATAALHAAGLKASGPAGVSGVVHVVTGEAPAAGTQVPAGSTVTLSTKSEKETSKKTSGSNTWTGPGKPPITTPGNPVPAPVPAPHVVTGTTPATIPAPAVPSGRWQNEDTIVSPAAASAADTGPEAADSVMDVVPHRPLGF
jgi:hypothetical protein